MLFPQVRRVVGPFRARRAGEPAGRGQSTAPTHPHPGHRRRHRPTWWSGRRRGWPTERTTSARRRSTASPSGRRTWSVASAGAAHPAGHRRVHYVRSSSAGDRVASQGSERRWPSRTRATSSTNPTSGPIRTGPRRAGSPSPFPNGGYRGSCTVFPAEPRVMSTGAYLWDHTGAHPRRRPPCSPVLASSDARPAAVGHPAGERNRLSVRGTAVALRSSAYRRPRRDRSGSRGLAAADLHRPGAGQLPGGVASGPARSLPGHDPPPRGGDRGGRVRVPRPFLGTPLAVRPRDPRHRGTTPAATATPPPRPRTPSTR